MKNIHRMILSLTLLATSAAAQPVVTTVVNSASFSPAPLPNSALAQGSFFTIFGTGLGPATPVLWSPYPLPTQLGDSSTVTNVDITIGNGFSSTSVPAYLYFTYSGQINAIVPSGTPTGAGFIAMNGSCSSGCLTVTVNGQASVPVPITVVPNSFGTFSLNSAGNGPGIITDTKYAAITLTHTAKPGDYVILWGTGLGPAPDIADEQTAAQCPQGCDLRGPNLAVTVWVGGESATVAYAGRAPDFSALDQIVFTVPQGVQGCYVPVAVQVGPPTSTQVVGNFTTLSIDPAGGSCSDAGVKVSDVASALSSKGSANVGAIGLFSDYLSINTGTSVVNVDSDAVSGLFATFTTRQLENSVGLVQAPSAGTCSVASLYGENLGAFDPSLSLVTYLDGGSQLTVTNPSGSSASVPKVSGGATYASTVGGVSLNQILGGSTGSPTFFLNNSDFSSSAFNLSAWPNAVITGAYKVAGAGGSSVGAFSQSINVPAAVTWTNQSVAAGPIPRTQALNITWSGGDPNGFVDITGVGFTASSFNSIQSSTPGAMFQCIVPTSAGSFNVPSYVLQSLPGTTTGLLMVGNAGAPAPIIPAPGGLDAAYLYYRFLGGTSVSWQ